MPGTPVVVCETPTFVKQAATIWSEEERAAFIDFIARNPEAGDLIPETGGVRKVRWSRSGMGRRGGVRVVYYFHDRRMPIYLLLAYTKSRQTDLTTEQRQRVAELVRVLKASSRPR